MPLPPPPAAAFTSRGKPTSPAREGSSVEGSVGTPASTAIRLAASLSPIDSPILAPLLSTVDPGSEQFGKNRDDCLEQLDVIDTLLAQAEAGGGPDSIARMRSRGKMPIRERIANVLDPDTPFLEISALAGYGSDYTVGGGMVVGVGVIAGTECVIMGNDPSVLGGALTPYAAKKWSRAIEIARKNHMP